jgi:hypothetical protein
MRDLPASAKGYKEQGDDLVGFYAPDIEGATELLHFIPKEARLLDSKIDKSKPSILIIASLVDESILLTKDEGGDSLIVGKPGDRFGIWAKPGMRALRKLADVKVIMYPEGEKDVGKGNPMKLYKILSADIGEPLPITDDLRKESKHVATFLTRGAPGEENSDEPPAF